MKVMVMVPHPDDEVLGCGGTIHKHARQGDEVYLCIVTEAYTPDWSKEFIEKRKYEIKDSCLKLRVKRSFLLGFPTAKLDTVPQKELNDAISKIVAKVKPEVLYIPHRGDLNKDHGIIYQASLVAARPFSTVKKILAYETLSETEWGTTPFLPNIFINIEQDFKAKLEAMKAYPSELREFPHPRSVEAIEALAKKRGSEAGYKFAEAFMLIRSRES